ncbi:restriction endonuclease subunit S [Prevotella copri]|uniref:Restriction endonuclease subunit S n=1 Tax=Segatella copri TaxID=165179 RepID=A0A6A7VQT0_9BACT|nr:restriction endonuclease subunit S [Segatella copri]MQM58868.1 restriction endonuclease subunit S [Segatella copri]MQN07677.1 restriction endonuclease subunit S [Segatella copri]MQN09325.1 restriction endonuclease subunit S [Segatella copri]MQO59650.1 restriction endonuclease subunit S [Segatella copri]MQO65093.1 restriction endonuclease subunit S [Segatella copri]
MEWKEVRLGDVCTRVCSGGTPKSTNLSYYGGEIPWLNTKEIDFNRIYSTEKTITDSGLNNSSAKWIVPNTVTVAMYGATAGKSCIVKVPMTTNQACCNLTINDEVADYEFVYYTLKNDYTTLASLANGGAQQNLNAQIIKDYVLQMPSLADQRRIASILSSLDRKIELNNKINADLEEMAQAIFKNWFIDFEPFKDGKFVDSELGMIPEGWKVGTLEDLITIKYGKDHKKLEDGTFPVYGSGGLMRFVNSWLYNGESVLIPRKGTLDNIMYVCEKFWTVDTMFFSVPKMDYVMKYVYNYIKRFDFSKMNEGTSVPSNTAARLNKMQILIPTHEVLEMYDETLCPIYNKRKMNDKESRTLSLLRDTLLPRLMSGELEVPE